MGTHARPRRPGEWRECERLPRRYVIPARYPLVFGLAAGSAALGMPVVVVVLAGIAGIIMATIEKPQFWIVLLAGLGMLALAPLMPQQAPAHAKPLTAVQLSYRHGAATGRLYAPNASNGPWRYSTHHPSWIWCHNAYVFTADDANSGIAGETGMHNSGLPKNYYPHTVLSRAWMAGCISKVDPKLARYGWPGPSMFG